MFGVLTLLIVSVLVCHVCITIIASIYIDVCMCAFMYSVLSLTQTRKKAMKMLSQRKSGYPNALFQSGCQNTYTSPKINR